MEEPKVKSVIAKLRKGGKEKKSPGELPMWSIFTPVRLERPHVYSMPFRKLPLVSCPT